MVDLSVCSLVVWCELLADVSPCCALVEWVGWWFDCWFWVLLGLVVYGLFCGWFGFCLVV